MKRLLILGGIALSKEIVETAHSAGIDVYVTDYLPDSPAKRVADKSFMVSTTDVDAVVDLIKREHIDGVLTGYIDLLLPYYVQICRKSGLPCYATEEQIAITTDKNRFKDLCRKYSVPTVPEYSYEEVLAGKAVFPVLVKPVDNSGALGIFICTNLDEFKENYEKSLAFSPSKHLLIERYMTGKEATIFYYLHKGEIYLMGMGDRHMLKFDDNLLPLPVGYTFPSIYLPMFEQEVNESVIAMFKSLGMSEGMVFMQSFIEEGKCLVYEMGYRLTGSIEHHLISKSTGFNPLAAIIDFAVGNEVDDSSINAIDPHKGCLANVSLLITPGTIKTYRGIEEAKRLDGVLHIFLSYDEGSELGKQIMGRLAQLAVRVLIYADDKTELINRMEKVKNTIQVLDIDGRDMLIKDYSYVRMIQN